MLYLYIDVGVQVLMGRTNGAECENTLMAEMDNIMGEHLSECALLVAVIETQRLLWASPSSVTPAKYLTPHDYCIKV